MKTKLTAISLFIFLAASYLLLMPKAYFPFSEKFDLWNANLIRSTLHYGRFFLDPAFKDRYYVSLISERSLDVVIPLVEKDLITAKETVKSIHAMILHPIQNIYVVSPESASIRAFCKENGCIFIPENEAIDNYEEIRKLGGWVLQQFIKLSADKFTKSQDILIVDGDTVFLRPQVFIDDRRDIYTFHIAGCYTERIKKFTRNLMKTNQYFKLDLISHHMIFKRKWLQELKNTIEEINGCSWQKAIISQASFDPFSFSEYDIYATYVLHNHRSFTRILSGANTFIFRDKFKFFEDYRSVYSVDHKSISSHSFMKFNK